MIYSHSRLSLVARCEWAYWLQYVKGLQPVVPPRPMHRGGLLAAGLERLFKGSGLQLAIEHMSDRVRDSINMLDPEDPRAEELMAQALDDVLVCTNVLERFHEWWAWDDWEVLQVNLGQGAVPAIEIPLYAHLGEHTLIGVIDALLVHKPTDAVWLIDWKGRASAIDSVETEASQDTDRFRWQQGLYVSLLDAYGIETAGTSIVQMRMQVPKQPKINKDGSVSRTRIASDWSTYRQAVIDAGRNPTDYAEMEAKLDTVWFAQTFTYRGPHELELFRQNAVEWAARAQDLHDFEINPGATGRQPTRHISAGCKWCLVRDACWSMNGFEVEPQPGYTLTDRTRTGDPNECFTVNLAEAEAGEKE